MIEIKSNLLAHIVELKKKVLYSLVFFIIAFGVSFYFVEDIFSLFTRILPPNQNILIFTGLTEVFFVYIKLSLFCALVFSAPVFLYNFYQFLAPGLYKNEKIILLPYLFFSPLLFLCGALFVYFLVSPQIIAFFSNFAGNVAGFEIKLLPKISEFYSLVIDLFLAFGLSFQLPILLSLLVDFSILEVEQLERMRRIAIVGIFCLAAIITPPDAISQIILAIPLILLYEISIILCKLKRKTGDKKRCTI